MLLPRQLLYFKATYWHSRHVHLSIRGELNVKDHLVVVIWK